MKKNHYLIAIIILAASIFITTFVIQNLPLRTGGNDIIASRCLTSGGIIVGCRVMYSGYLFLIDVALLLVIIYLLAKHQSS